MSKQRPLPMETLANYTIVNKNILAHWVETFMFHPFAWSNNGDRIESSNSLEFPVLPLFLPRGIGILIHRNSI